MTYMKEKKTRVSVSHDRHNLTQLCQTARIKRPIVAAQLLQQRGRAQTQQYDVASRVRAKRQWQRDALSSPTQGADSYKPVTDNYV